MIYVCEVLECPCEASLLMRHHHADPSMRWTLNLCQPHAHAIAQKYVASLFSYDHPQPKYGDRWKPSPPIKAAPATTS
jgi:hypothetical protein